MKLEDQVCTLEQAKRLKELGVSQDTSFVWCCVMPDPTGEKYYYGVLYRYEVPTTLMEAIAAAFTASELGIMLPVDYKVWYDGKNLGRKDSWVCDSEWATTYGATQAEAMARMLLHLIEEKNLSVTLVNTVLAL